MGNEEQKRNNEEGLFDYEHQNLFHKNQKKEPHDIDTPKGFLMMKKPYIVILCVVFFYVFSSIGADHPRWSVLRLPLVSAIFWSVTLIISIMLLVWSWRALNRGKENAYNGMTFLLLPITFFLPPLIFNLNSLGLGGVPLVPLYFVMIGAFIYRLFSVWGKNAAYFLTIFAVAIILSSLLFRNLYQDWRASLPFSCSRISEYASWEGDCIDGIIVSKDPNLQIKVVSIYNRAKHINGSSTLTNYKPDDIITFNNEQIWWESMPKIESMSVGDLIAGLVDISDCRKGTTADDLIANEAYCEIFMLGGDSIVITD